MYFYDNRALANDYRIFRSFMVAVNGAEFRRIVFRGREVRMAVQAALRAFVLTIRLQTQV